MVLLVSLQKEFPIIENTKKYAKYNKPLVIGLLYSADWTRGLDSRTGFMSMRGQEERL